MSGSIFLGSTSYSVNEQNGTVTFSIERTGDLTAPVSVQYATNANTATQGLDFTDTDGSAIIAAGESSVQITIPIINDTLSEATEKFNISLISVSGGELLFPRTALVSILDDENPVTEPVNPPFSSDFTVVLEDLPGSYGRPVNMEWVPGSSNQAFVVELGGVLKIINTDTGQLLSTALDISSKVNSNRDGGLLDIALHPDFENNPYLYAFYVVDPAGTANNSGDAGADGQGNRFAHVVRFDVDTSGAVPTIDAGSETILVGAAGQTLSDISGNGAQNFSNALYADENTYVASDIDQNTGEYKQDYIKMDSTSHIGGALAFGPDGNLYISIGDGVSFNYADKRGLSVQSVDALAGKILRVDPLTGNGLADNPFTEPGSNFTENSSKVWQTGLRNPYAMAFSEDGELYISETGWTSWEEVNMGGKGANFGWPWYEGGDSGILEQTPTYQDMPEAQAFYTSVANGDIDVTAAYRGFSHDVNDPGYNMQAIVGGSSVYTADKYPDVFKDDYFFFDIVNSRLFSVDTNDRTQLEYIGNVGGTNPIVNMVQGPDGYLYAITYNGEVKKLIITETNPTTNEAPFVTSAIDEQDAITDEVFDFVIPNGTFYDPNNDQLTYTATLSNGDPLPSWLTIDAVTGTFSGTPDQNAVGKLTIKVVAADDGGLNTSETFNLVVAQPNDAPTLTAPALNQTTQANAAFSYTIPSNMFVDDGSFVLSAELIDGSALPAWLNFDAATGTFSGTSSINDAGNLVVKITATDGFGKTGIDYFMINVEETPNTAPTVTAPIADQMVDEDTALNFVFGSTVFTDPEGQTLTYTATLANGDLLPSWLDFDGVTRAFTGTPNDADIANLDIRVTASDPAGLSVSDDFALVVNSVNDVPILVTELLDQNIEAGSPLNFVVPSTTFVDADDATLILTATLTNGDPLPSWLTFDEQTGTLSGTPTNAEVGDVSVTVTATDAASLSVSDAFVIAVTPVNTAPTVSAPIADQMVDEDTALNFVVDNNAFTDPEGATLIYTATLTNGDPLPTWLNFDAATRTFTGTPNDADIANLDIRVTASDPAGLSVSDDFAMVVNSVNDVPVLVTNIVDQSTIAGDVYNFVIPSTTFADADDATLTLTATLPNGDPLPAWLTFDEQTGTLSGTPTNAEVGDVTVTVTATDAAGLSISDAFVIAVTAVNTAPTVSAPIADQTVDEDTALNFVVDGNAFNDAEGAALTYTATLVNGDPLPAWLSFDVSTRTFTGTPNDADIANLDIRVTASDPAGLSVSDDFALVVNSVNDAPIVAANLADQSTQAGDTFNFVIPATTFTDADDVTLTLSATLSNGDPLPSWLTFDAQTGTISGLPTSVEVGDLNIFITATDAAGLSVSDEFQVTVAPEQANETLHNDVANTVQFLNGTEAKDVFVINGNVADYNWGPTDDGLGIVVWGTTGHDILIGFEEIRFNDLNVSLVQTGNDYIDIANSTQFLTGESANDTFVIDGNSTDYNWGPTENGGGVVVWGSTGHDLLFEFENIEFNDQTIAIDEVV